jgi:hypothetical protein
MDDLEQRQRERAYQMALAHALSTGILPADLPR